MIRRIFRLFKIIGRQFTGVSRTEDAIEFYDKHLFKGRTFEDLQKGGVFYSDAAVAGETETDNVDDYKALSPGMEWLEIETTDDVLTRYLDFYKMLMN